LPEAHPLGGPCHAPFGQQSVQRRKEVEIDPVQRHLNTVPPLSIAPTHSARSMPCRNEQLIAARSTLVDTRSLDLVPEMNVEIKLRRS
jgi:hypothetical protein